MYVLYKIKKHILHQNVFGCMKTFKTKKFWKFSNFFSEQCTGCVVRWSAEISRQSENIQALLKIGKNERRSTVASALKGYTTKKDGAVCCMMFIECLMIDVLRDWNTLNSGWRCRREKLSWWRWWWWARTSRANHKSMWQHFGLLRVKCKKWV